MNEIMTRRRALMGASSEQWINILPGMDWNATQQDFVVSNVRAITKQLISVIGATAINVPCPFVANGDYYSWNGGNAGVFLRMFDAAETFIKSASVWGRPANQDIALEQGTAFVLIGFQRDISTPAINYTLHNPLTVNSVSYNTEFNGQKLRA